MASPFQNSVLLLAAGALCACHPVRARHMSMIRRDADAPLAVGQRLDCPEDQGALERVSAAPDGQSCLYKGEGDREVALTLMPLKGQAPAEALGAEEARLRALLPVPREGALVSVDAGRKDGRDAARIDLPGLHIDADGDKADVRILGIEVHGEGDHGDVKAPYGNSGAVIHAGPGGAEIRTGTVGRRSANLMFLLAGDGAGPGGYKVVGYLARGPVGGPLVVAEFKSRRHGERDAGEDVERLVDRNLKLGADET
jgi:hypothetical protein